jgi:prenyltransferase beta subunit
MTRTIEAFLESRLRDGGFVEMDQSAPTMEATRFGMEAARRSGIEPVPLRDAVEWVLGLWREEGGFAERPGAEAADAASTYYAARLLEIAGARARLHPGLKSLGAWLSKAWQDEADRTLDLLYYLARTATLLGIDVEPAVASEWARFLLACRDRSGSGALANVPGEESDVEHSYCGTQLLLGMGMPPAPSLRAWLRSCIDPEGGIRWAPGSPRRSLPTLYWGAHLALYLDVELDPSGVEAVLAPLRNPDGGYGSPRSSIWQTYCAVSASLIAEISAGRRPRADLGLE